MGLAEDGDGISGAVDGDVEGSVREGGQNGGVVHVPAAERVAATLSVEVAQASAAWPASFSATLVRPPW